MGVTGERGLRGQQHRVLGLRSVGTQTQTLQTVEHKHCKLWPYLLKTTTKREDDFIQRRRCAEVFIRAFVVPGVCVYSHPGSSQCHYFLVSISIRAWSSVYCYLSYIYFV